MEYIPVVISAIIIPITIFIYSLILYKNKVIIFNRNNNVEVKKDSYYKLQLLFCIITCILLVFESLMTITSISFFMCYYIATMWLMSYLLKTMSIKMEYVSSS